MKLLSHRTFTRAFREAIMYQFSPSSHVGAFIESPDFPPFNYITEVDSLTCLEVR